MKKKVPFAPSSAFKALKGVVGASCVAILSRPPAGPLRAAGTLARMAEEHTTNSPGHVPQNSIPAVLVGSTVIGVPAVGAPVLVVLVVAALLTGAGIRWTGLIVVALVAGTVGQCVTQLIKRPMERRRGRSIVHGAGPTVAEIMPVVMIVSVGAALVYGNAVWLLWGALAGLAGLVPLLGITRPWSEGASEGEYQDRSKAVRDTLHTGFGEIKRDIHHGR